MQALIMLSILHSSLGFSTGLTILPLPLNTVERISNSNILTQAISTCTTSLAVILKAPPNDSNDNRYSDPSTIRNYVSELYSDLWDTTIASRLSSSTITFPDVTIYPPLPNLASSQIIEKRPSLQCIIGSSTDTTSTYTSTSCNSLESHAEAINSSRKNQGLNPLIPLGVLDFLPSDLTSDDSVTFFEDVAKGERR
jgi:hypothetical protein